MKTTHRSNKQRSKRSEARLASLLGGRVQPASGALPVAALKGDVKTDFFLVDDKVTAKGSYSVKLEFMRKLRREAFGVRRRPCLSISFENQATFYVINEESMLEFIRLLREEADNE